jgi:hypothetical protein
MGRRSLPFWEGCPKCGGDCSGKTTIRRALQEGVLSFWKGLASLSSLGAETRQTGDLEGAGAPPKANAFSPAMIVIYVQSLYFFISQKKIGICRSFFMIPLYCKVLLNVPFIFCNNV